MPSYSKAWWLWHQAMCLSETFIPWNKQESLAYLNSETVCAAGCYWAAFFVVVFNKKTELRVQSSTIVLLSAYFSTVGKLFHLMWLLVDFLFRLPHMQSTKNKTQCWSVRNLPPDSPMLIQSGLATLAMAKMSAARKRHPDITVSLSMSVNTKGGTEGDRASRSDLNPHVVSHHCGIWPVPLPRPLFTLYLISGGLMSMHGVISLCCSSESGLTDPTCWPRRGVSLQGVTGRSTASRWYSWGKHEWRLYLKNKILFYACTGLGAWVCMNSPISLPTYGSCFLPREDHRRKTPPMLTLKRLSGASPPTLAHPAFLLLHWTPSFLAKWPCFLRGRQTQI